MSDGVWAAAEAPAKVKPRPVRPRDSEATESSYLSRLAPQRVRVIEHLGGLACFTWVDAMVRSSRPTVPPVRAANVL